MIRFFAPALLFLALSCQGERYRETDKMLPTDHLFWQRAYPDNRFDIKGWQHEISAVHKAERIRNKRNAGTWETQGPGNLGARVNTIAVHPIDHQTILIGYSAGGIYKTVNGGLSWKPVFDNFPVMAIGDLVFDPTNSNVIYAGTGDPNISGIPFSGQGIYKSLDAGETWSYLGLGSAGIITEIVIDPTNSEIIYAASMGIPFYRDENRGLFKSVDGGLSWKKVLFLGDGTGVIDVAIDPNDPQILYAAGWDRIRNYEESVTEGDGARIHKSLDGGDSWTMLTGGLPNRQHSRIGIELSSSDPGRLYAVYVDLDFELEEIYTTDDGGEKWSAIPTNSSSGLGTQPFQGFGWYFGKIRLDPKDDNKLYLLGVRLWRYNGNIRRWSRVDQFTADVVHADKHDLYFGDDDTLLLATDGGLYRSVDDATSWLDIEDIPTTQIYRVAYNPHMPNMYFGGAQDNGSSYGNKSVLSDWVQYFQGDGFRTLFHPTDAELFYVETQSGGLSVTRDGGKNFERAVKGIDGGDNINWDAPVIMSSHNPDVLYYGTDRVYQSKTGADENFLPISNRLTDEVVLLDATSNISALEESPFDASIIYAGTGDGNLHRTKNTGTSWQNISQGLPDRYITSIVHSSEDESVLYVSQSGFKSGERLPHIHRSDNQGDSWTDISGDLPNLPVNDILVLDNNDDRVLFAATDAGVYFSKDAGGHWLRLGNNMPLIPVFDLDYNQEFNYLIAGTHAKSIMTFDLSQEGLSTDVGVSANSSNFVPIRIFPNPTVDVLRFDKQSIITKPSEILITDLQGKVLLRSTIVDNQLDISMLLPGAYQVLIVEREKLKVGRFVKI